MDTQAALPPFSSEILQQLLSTKSFGRPTLVYESISSTNTLAFQVAQKPNQHGAVILAEQQTAGKGRLGRTWHSPARKNLYFSIVLTPKLSSVLLPWIPLLTGLAMAESLESLSGLPICLKWPNDIMVREKKLAGILCESKQNEENGQVVIVGVGVNLNSEIHDFPEELQKIATSMKVESLQSFDRHALLAVLLKNIEIRYHQLISSEIDVIRSLYISRCATLQRTIRVRLITGKEVEGLAADIGLEGELLMTPSIIQGNQSTIAVRSGDVFHIR